MLNALLEPFSCVYSTTMLTKINKRGGGTIIRYSRVHVDYRKNVTNLEMVLSTIQTKLVYRPTMKKEYEDKSCICISKKFIVTVLCERKQNIHTESFRNIKTTHSQFENHLKIFSRPPSFDDKHIV